MRPTFGRTPRTKDGPLEVIGDLPGHEDSMTPIRGLALRNDDLVPAMPVLDQALAPLRCREREAG